MAIFSDEAIKKIVKETIIPEVPEGKTLALVGSIDPDGAEVVLTFRKRWGHSDWQMFGAVRHDWTASLGTSARAKVLVSF